MSERARIDAGVSGTARGNVGEVLAAALRLGLTSFGGPIAHLGYFRADYVVRRKWLSEGAFAELVGLCQFLPGPASSQLGFAIGWVRAVAAGALAAWLGFTLPSALLMLGFARLAPELGGPLGMAIVHGLKLAAVAVVAQAVIGMARTLAPDLRRRLIALAATAAMLVAASPALQLLVIAAGAGAGLLLCRTGPSGADVAPLRTPGRRAGVAALLLFAILLGGALLAAGEGGWGGLTAIFVRAGALVFGGGHVVLPLLREGLVPAWLSDSAFLAGYGAAQALPGPLFAVASDLGAAAMPQAPVAAAVLATLAIFAPGLLLVTGALAFGSGLRARPGVRRAMAGANAAVVGLLAAALYDPLGTSSIARPLDLAIAAAALLLLLRFRTPPIAVVLLCVGASVALTIAASP